MTKQYTARILLFSLVLCLFILTSSHAAQNQNNHDLSSSSNSTSPAIDRQWGQTDAKLVSLINDHITERMPAHLTEGSLPVKANFDWLFDTDGMLNIDDIQKEDNQALFKPLDVEQLPLESGSLWLRFTIAERDPRTPPQALLLDMGEGIAGTPTLYVPKHNILANSIAWQEYTPTQQSIFLMPEAKSSPTTAYIRLEGMPNPWFSPMLRTPHDAATNSERLATPAIIVTLIVVMLLCLLRGLTERGQWRIWASLYTAVVLFYVFNGVPSTSKGYIALKDMASVVAPGLALILLPHVARHLMRTNIKSRIIDMQYLLLTLPGIALALIPLLPGYAWTVRYLPLWPLLTILLVPTTLGAWLGGLPGARRFLIGTLLPPIGAALALVGLKNEPFLPLSILQMLPLWGIALGTLLIAGTTAPQEYRKDSEEKEPQKAKKRSIEQEIESNLDDPNLRIVQLDDAQSADDTAQQGTKNISTNLEEHLRWPLDQLLRDVSALESCALPPLVREHVTSLGTVVRDISQTISAPINKIINAPSMGGASDDIFELQSLMRQAHDSVSALADSKNIALSWFMPPHLSQSYKGDALHLLFVLRLLLESSVRATNRGAVQLAVRRVPESINPGHLLFTVTDTGTGKPPQERSITAMARAWELAASSHGFLGVESNAYGASISFTLHCEVTTPEMVHRTNKVKELDYPRIIIVSDNDADRQLWAFFLEKLPYTIIEARNKKEVLSVYTEEPAKLILFDARAPKHEVRKILYDLKEYEEQNNLAFTPRLALCQHAAQWKEFSDAGFSHHLLMPITRTNLRGAIIEILPHKHALQKNEQVKENIEQAPVPVEESAQEEVIIDTGTPLVDMPTLSLTPDSSSEPDVPVEPTPVAQEMVLNDFNLQRAIEPEAAPLQEQVEQVQEVTPAEPAEIVEQQPALVQETAQNLEPDTSNSNVMSEDELERYIVMQNTIQTQLEETQPTSVEMTEQSEPKVQAETMPEEVAPAPKNKVKISKPVKKLNAGKPTSNKLVEGKKDDALKPLIDSLDAPSAKVESKPFSQAKEKSNAAYLTAFVDTGAIEPKQEQVELKEVETQDHKLVEPVAKSIKIVSKPKQPRVLKAVKPVTAMGAPKVGDEPVSKEEQPKKAIKVVKAKTKAVATQEKPKAKSKPKAIIAKEVTQAAVISKPVDEVKAQPKPKKVIKFKPSAQNAVKADPIDTTEWVGEPMPITKDVAEQKKIKPSVKTSSKQEAIKPSAVEKLELPKQEKPKKSVMQIVKNAAKTLKPAKAKPVVSEDLSHTQEWVGEPMPVLKDIAESANKLEQKANTQDELTFEPILLEAPTQPNAKLNAEQSASVMPSAHQQEAKSSNASDVAPVPTKEPTSVASQASNQTPLEVLLNEIDQNLLEGKRQYQAQNPAGVAESAALIAQNAENFGLRTLNRLARTVEAAARAGDMDALHDLFPELEISVERNRIALQA